MWFKIKQKLKKLKILLPIRKLKKRIIYKKLIKATHKYGYDINTYINEILEDQFEYYAMCGNLLGIVRENGFIKYDNDMDYGLTITDDSVWEKVYNKLVKAGFLYHHHFEKDGKITEIAFRYKGVHVDFFGVYVSEDRGCICSGARYEDIEYKSDEFTPIQVNFDYEGGVIKKQIKNTVFNIPTYYHKFLVSNYGESYMTPIKNFSPDKSMKDVVIKREEKMFIKKDLSQKTFNKKS
ncbi:MAG: hypothetical protein E7372_04435 [Clostridiales bacterium]|nr:hypothetical protein [Clostridiales bacterium]